MNKEKLPVTGNISKVCSWILKTSFECPPQGIRCEAKCNSYVSRDEDRNKVRVYEPFCPKHKYEAERLDNTNSEDENE
jgi:hypothetical protein